MSSASTVSDGVKGCDGSKGEEVTGPSNTTPDAAHSSPGSQKRPTPSSAASVTLGARGKTTTRASEKVREILEKRRAARAAAEEKKKQEATAEQNTTVAKKPVGRDAGGDAKGEVGTVAEHKEGIDASNQPDVKSETKAQATGDSLGGGTDKTVVKGDKQEQGEVTAQLPEHASEEHERPTTVKDGVAANKPSETSQQTTRKHIQHTGETNTAPVGADGSKEKGTNGSTEVQNRPSEKEVGALQKDVEGDVLTEKSSIQDKPTDKDTIAVTTNTPTEDKAAQGNHANTMANQTYC
ncbi:hypothetical protein SARC_05114 [Sphaeroforma arctica JP610]|uniref:Uncharacterized protein n=1 Tax=Sphaeroforma arctica JP610 TaxID=667725 RepID=A0A0L0G0L7_9EUKA|nr:hypothetical protein SARC_05114 [Sphaeroforma arctica JP610]KNC82595.1 hypothetical protein SARC_05114 [Sphaeroforma arctica JP610]|eukprot:XP_014156497.1 hypothetical protein SARC_05114 [Sphaeroforma arctica JP610]